MVARDPILYAEFRCIRLTPRAQAGGKGKGKGRDSNSKGKGKRASKGSNGGNKGKGKGKRGKGKDKKPASQDSLDDDLDGYWVCSLQRRHSAMPLRCRWTW
jgi:hypothetical protein